MRRGKKSGRKLENIKKEVDEKEIERLEQPVTILKSRRLPTDILDKL